MFSEPNLNLLEEDSEPLKGDMDPIENNQNLNYSESVSNGLSILKDERLILNYNKKASSKKDCVIDTNEEIYEKPGMILNKDLSTLSKSGEYKLNKCLCESYDYVLVSVDAWDYFKRWYGYDIEIIYKDDE